MSSLPFKVKAVYEYKSPHDDDLSFPIGQIITVTEEEDADWYVGEYTDGSGQKQDGLFPRNFVEKYEPEAPPRPTRPRVKKEPSSTQAIEPTPESKLPEPATEPATAPATVTEPMEAPKVVETTSPPPKRVEPALQTKPEPPKPAPASKGPPPPVSVKPSSFKDRIAAFNKPEAQPLAPVKPGPIGAGSTGFIKKPFVAPPPSRNAYVPPPREPVTQKAYRRDEDPEIKERLAEDQENAERAGMVVSESQEPAEDEPKTTSLKDRIALLQKQQQEQAARRADASQKEKPKKPQKKRTESSEDLASTAAAPTEESSTQAVTTGEVVSRDSSDEPNEPNEPQRPPIARRTSRETRPIATDVISDGNEADQSGAGDTTEDGDASSTEVEEHDEDESATQTTTPSRTSTGLAREVHAMSREANESAAVGNNHGNEEDEPDRSEGQEDEDEGEEESEDEETRRKRELRERMAKMSGGMGMPGMFAMPPAHLATKKKRPSGSNETREQESTTSPTPSQRMPMIPVPGLPRVNSPPMSGDPEVSKESEPRLASTAERSLERAPDVEDLEQVPSSAISPAVRAVPPIPQDRPLPPPPPSTQRGVPPRTPSGRQAPLSPQASSAPPPPPRAPPPQEEEHADDDEEEEDEEDGPVPTQISRTISQDLPARAPPPPIPGVPQRPDGPRSPPSQAKRISTVDTVTSPASLAEKRLSRGPPPPPPGAATMPPVPTTESRPPPPPPPTAAPPSRKSTGTENADSPINAEEMHSGESDYEGDYDTDIAPGADHKNALNQVHDREPSIDESILSEEPHGRSPPIAPPPIPGGMAQRGPPPPPPHAAPVARGSYDAPRAPPPVPPTRNVPPGGDEDYDPYAYHAPQHGIASPSQRDADPLIQASEPALYGDAPRSQAPPAPAIAKQTQIDRAPPPPPPGAARTSREVPRPSMEPPRRSMTTGRMSSEMPRPSGDQGQIAQDVDLGQSSQWWTEPNTPPPVFQRRNDLLCEFEDTTTPKRGGRTTISRDVYVLFTDYSQTIVTAQFDSKNSSEVILEQRHEVPPARLRQDQLEAAYGALGTSIAATATKEEKRTVGDGTAQSLIVEVLKSQKTALLPVGTRAYGALVYANMANATVTQLDEIRAGDIISFRNAKFSGKHGAMHAKYSDDVGKPEHVGIVVEWDGTKKKVRALEQGRDDKKKVRVESFRLGDLKSGEVKIWRVMGRNWVGWDK